MSNGPAVLNPEPSTLEPIEGPDKSQKWVRKILDTLFNPSATTTAVAILTALIIGALIVVAFDSDVQRTAGYLFAQPADFFSAVWNAFSSFFTSLIRGSIFDWRQSTVQGMFRPITETIVRATPLIIAGLAIAVSFTAGLFNIGVQGQLIMGGLFAGFVGFYFDLPVGLHVLLAVVGALLGGAIYGFIPGFLKSRLGANEVIVTIMLNSIATLFLAAMLNTKLFHGDGFPGKSRPIGSNSAYPLLAGTGFRLNFGIIVAILATIFVWWLIDRSTFGFEIRASGANQDAARTAGMSVKNTIMWTLVISGALAGLAATGPVLGTEKALTAGMAGSLGFDAITVALLGKSRPIGVFFAGLLFGALNAGGALMQSSAGIPVDIVQITQAIIVLMIAASEAIRYMRERRSIREATVSKVEHKDVSEGKTVIVDSDGVPVEVVAGVSNVDSSSKEGGR